jgi:hypothetical protein
MKHRHILFTIIVIALTTLVGATTNLAFAASNSQSINVTYKTYGSGLGTSNGKRNGVWHYFAKNRKVSLKVTSKSGAGTGQATLYRSQAFIDTSYGTTTTKVGTHSFGNKTNTTSGKYYLIFFGGNTSTTQKIRGSIHD